MKKNKREKGIKSNGFRETDLYGRTIAYHGKSASYSTLQTAFV
jgi:hypothetical protein